MSNEETKQEPKETKQESEQKIIENIDPKKHFKDSVLMLQKLWNESPDNVKNDPKFSELSQKFHGNAQEYADSKRQAIDQERKEKGSPEVHWRTNMELVAEELDGLAESIKMQGKFEAFDQRLGRGKKEEEPAENK